MGAGAEKEAVVKARLDGVDDVTGGFDKIGKKASEAGGQVSKGWKDAGGAIRDSVAGVVSDLGHVVTAAAAINFAGSVAQVHQLEASVARMAVASNQRFDSMKESVNSLSVDMNELPSVTAEWVQSVAKAVYSYDAAAGAARSAAQYAADVGETAQEVAPLVITLEELTGAAGKSGDALGSIVAQARLLGTVGGPKSVGDQVEHLRGQLSYLAGDVEKASALIAGFGGNKGFTPQQRERALGAVMSRIEGNVEGFERFLGHKITDEYGHVTDMTGVIKELQDYGKRGRGQRFRLEQTVGREAMQAIMHTDVAAIRAAETVKPAADEMKAAQERLRASAPGARKAAEVRKAITMQETVGEGSTIDDISRWLSDKSAAHPILTGLGAAAVTKLGAKAVTGLFNAAGSAIAGGGEAAAAGAGGAGASGAGAGTAGAGGGSGLFGSGMFSGAAGVGLLGVGAGILGTSYWMAHQNDELVNKVGLSESEFDYMVKQGEGIKLRRESLKRRSGGMVVFDKGQKAPSYEEATGQAAKGEPGAHPPSEAEKAGAVPAAARAPVGPSPELKAIIEGLVKAGASLQLAQETAAKMQTQQGQPVQIEIVNMTGGEIDARERGRQ